MPEYARRRQFVAKSHLTYGPTSLTAAPGDPVDGLPSESIGWLLEQGHIAEVKAEHDKGGVLASGLTSTYNTTDSSESVTSFPVVPHPRRSTD